MQCLHSTPRPALSDQSPDTTQDSAPCYAVLSRPGVLTPSVAHQATLSMEFSRQEY